MALKTGPGKLLRRPGKLNPLRPVTAAALLCACAVLVIFVARASGAFVSAETEAGALSGAAGVVNDSAASGGRAVAFGTAQSPSPNPVQGAVKGFDEAGVSAGIGNNYSTAQWATIKSDGFQVFITDPVSWNSECSDGNCTKPVGTCTIDSGAVAQIQDAYNVGVNYAVYTRNPNCLTKAITGLSSTLQAHLSFALFDIETNPSVPLTQAMVNSVTALGQTPVVYSYQGAWQTIMGGSTAFSQYALQDEEVPNWGVAFPAPYPAGYPVINAMPNPYGGWSGKAPKLEQQQANGQIAGISGSANAVDLDSVDVSWLQSLPHHF